MSDLEDDVLMAFLKLSRETKVLKERQPLVEAVWKDLDLMVRAMLEQPMIQRILEKELMQLRASVEAVLMYDAEHSGGSDDH